MAEEQEEEEGRGEGGGGVASMSVINWIISLSVIQDVKELLYVTQSESERGPERSYSLYTTCWECTSGEVYVPTLYLLACQVRISVGDSGNWNCFKGDVGQTSETRRGARMGFSERTDTILN